MHSGRFGGVKKRHIEVHSRASCLTNRGSADAAVNPGHGAAAYRGRGPATRHLIAANQQLALGLWTRRGRGRAPPKLRTVSLGPRLVASEVIVVTGIEVARAWVMPAPRAACRS
jgi:hypothetical protein